MKNNFIIFGLHFNELDMVLPFIDYALSKYKDNVTLYMSLKNIPGADSHLEYLRTNYRLEKKYFFDEECFSKYKYVINFLGKIERFQSKRKDPVIAKNRIRYFGYLLSLVIMTIKRVSEYILRKPIKRFVDNLNITDKIVIYFSGEERFPTSAIVEIANKRNIDTVGFFQAFYLYSNMQYTVKSIIDKRPIKARIANYILLGKRKYCTYYLVGKSMKNTFLRSSGNIGFNKFDRVFETVTPRYTRGWTNKFRNYLMKKEQLNYGDEKKTNVVFFLSRVKQNVNFKEFVNIFHLLSRLDNINFIFKPHTRGSSFKNDKETIRASFGFDKIIVDGYDGSHINSMLLSDWADVGIVYGSSIAIQLLIDNVPIIVPSFVHTNSTILEKHKICITADSLDELINILTNNTKDDIRKLIDSARVEKFLNEYLDANKDYEQIMQEYYDAVVNNKVLNKQSLYI